MPASRDASIHFAVTVASTSGTYFNNAGAVAEGFTVAATGDTAPITVAAAGTSDLAVTVTGSGTGSERHPPAGIDCGATCTATFDDGTPVDLTATRGIRSTFAGWSGDCSGTGACWVTMDADRAVTATFAAVETDVPGAPTDVTATPGDGSAAVGWTAPASDRGAQATGTPSRAPRPGTRATCTRRPTDGSTDVGWSRGLTNDVEYTCAGHGT